MAVGIRCLAFVLGVGLIGSDGRALAENSAAGPQQQAGVSLSGRVLDGSGAVVPGVTVTLNGAPLNGVRRAVITDERGRYAFSGLASGEYEVRAELSGFRPARRSGLSITAEGLGDVDLTVEPAAFGETVTVTASRAPSAIAALPSSVTVLTSDAIEQQAAVSRNLHTILGKTVPGLGLSREAESSFGQNLRGRGMLVLVDGIPVNFELRQGALDELARIDLSRVDRVEVVRGASAVYGSEAAGGIVNIITRTGAGTGTTWRTELGSAFSTTHPGDSVSGRLSQSVAGSAGRIDYFGAAAFESAGAAFDAEGDRLPDIFPVGSTDNRMFDAGGTLGIKIDERQRVALSAHYNQAQRQESFGPVDGVVGERKARAVELPLGIGDPEDLGAVADRPYKRQATSRLSYSHSDLWGSRVTAQALYLRYHRLNNYFAFGGGQLEPQFRKRGARLDIDTPLRFLDGAAVSWGADYVFYEHQEPTNTGLPWTPPLEQESLAGFAQATLPVGKRLILRGGVRVEDFDVSVEDFRTNPAFGAQLVGGGTLDYGATTFNAGAVISPAEGVQVFGGFAQGFSITQVGRLLVNTRLPSIAAARPEPSKVDSFEAGVRVERGKARATLSGFYSKSDLGTSLVARGSGPPEVIRAPERTWGAEATLDVHPGPRWRTGGTASWQRGEEDPDFNDAYTPMPGWRIAPLKLTGYVEHETSTRWHNRLQVTHSGTRDAFPGSTAFGQGRVDAVTLVDAVASVRLGKGTLTLGVENVLNEFYFPPINQAFNDAFNYIAGRGRTVSIGYAIPWAP